MGRKKKVKRKRKVFKGFSKPLGRFLRWSMLVLFGYLFFMNAHITMELNKPSGIDDTLDKIGWIGKVVKFIRTF